MKTNHSSNCIDIRYSKTYAITMIVISALILIPSITQFDTARELQDNLKHIIMFIISLLILGFGIDAWLGKLAYRLDMQNKQFIIFGQMPFIRYVARKKPYEKIYAEGRDIYLENKGKKRILYTYPLFCNKSDVALFIQEVMNNKG